EINLEWARALQAQKPPQEVVARKIFWEAAAAYRQTGTELTGKEQRDEALWFEAVALLSGGFDHDAITVLDRYTKSGVRPERIGEAFYRLGECYLKENNSVQAEGAFKNCKQHQSSFQYPSKYCLRARYQIAQLLIAAGRLDDAQAELNELLE